MRDPYSLIGSSIVCIFLGVADVAAAQLAVAPTKVAEPPTAAATATIGAAIKLHDEGKFDQAIAQYLDLPYFIALKQNNLIEPFVYGTLQRAPISGVPEWLTANRARVGEFLAFTKTYQWPTN